MTIGISTISAFPACASYTDAPDTHWAAASIKSCTEKGIMQGYDGKFIPEGTLTRAEVAQICYNAYHNTLPSMITNASIDDVSYTAWYRYAMYWSVANGIMDMAETENGQYVYPNEVADRKFVALTLHRLAGKLGVALPETTTEIVFSDISGLSDEYQRAIGALQQAGVISGYPDGTYDPSGLLTRAQAAKLFDTYTDIEGLQSTSTGAQIVVDAPEPPNIDGLMTPDEFFATLKSYAES